MLGTKKLKAAASATIVVAAALLSGCEEAPLPETAVDQGRRVELFQQCLEALPAGPVSTKYNDWDEVVDSCESAAYYQARRCVRNCERSGIINETRQ